MSASRPAVEITGTVRDASGAPVPGAHVLFTQGPQPLPDIAAVTDAEGRFSLIAPTAGQYTLTCRADPLAGPPGTAETTVRVDRPAEAAASERLRVDLTLR
ncbi:carboxypeptidase-like regulatory domain-containing protein [Streptomyces sp. SYP-A7185]|uniref:carboxypeptidase-like regulatory domain-containing protein n=1 Tax=Streptomyces sp. SYP-A7185 TaxID=3040076 RepID=UPI0038F72759